MRQPEIYDHSLIRREIYNPTEHEIFFERIKTRDQYVVNSGIMLGPEIVRIPAKGRAILPHAYYIFHSKNGGPASLIVIFGKDIGRGLTAPSKVYHPQLDS